MQLHGGPHIQRGGGHQAVHIGQGQWQRAGACLLGRQGRKFIGKTLKLAHQAGFGVCQHGPDLLAALSIGFTDDAQIAFHQARHELFDLKARQMLGQQLGVLPLLLLLEHIKNGGDNDGKR